MTKELVIDSSLLDELMLQFKKAMEESYELRRGLVQTPTKEAYHTFVVETSKAGGILLGMSQEIGLLLVDMQRYIEQSYPTAAATEVQSKTASILGSLFSPLKGKGSN
jgi:hypothetical protein